MTCFKTYAGCHIFNCFIANLKGALSGRRQFLEIESPLKMMKNVFFFTSKALFILKILIFVSWGFGNVAKQLYLKNKVNLKFYDVTAWLTVVIHILPNISRSKVNQAMKFVQLIEYNIRKHFSWKVMHKIWWIIFFLKSLWLPI